MVMGRKQRDKKMRQNVMTKIGRNIADPEPTFRRSIVGMRCNEFGQRPGLLLVPAAMFLVDCGCVDAGAKAHRIQQVVPGGVERRIELIACR